MGRKRRDLASVVEKNSQISSAKSTRSGSNTVIGQSVSVSEKLSKLRIEGRNAERNRHLLGHTQLSRPIRDVSLIGDPEISALLGVRPAIQPDPRVKGRLAGAYLTPKSWLIQPQKRALTTPATRTTLESLRSICLRHITENIDSYRGLGMQYLAGHFKSDLLSSIKSQYSESAWADIVPEEDDTISWIDLQHTPCNARALMRYLPRMPMLLEVTLTMTQLLTGVGTRLSPVLRKLNVVVAGTSATTYDYDSINATFKALSRRLISLRHIIITSPSQELITSCALLMSSAADWSGAWSTVTHLDFVCTGPPGACDVGALTAAVMKIRSSRARGQYISVQTIGQHPATTKEISVRPS